MEILSFEISPTEKEYSNYTTWCWPSECGRYKIHRTLEKATGSEVQYKATLGDQHGHHTIWVECCPRLKANYPKNYKTLEEAIKACITHLEKEGKQVQCNLEEVVQHAKELGLANGGKRGASKAVATERVEVTSPAVIMPQPRPAGPVARDAYGSKIGSDQAKIAAVLTTTPTGMKELAKLAGVNGTTYGFFKKLIEQGKLGKTPDGKFYLLEERK